MPRQEMMFELKLMVQALDMSEGEPTEWPENYCRRC